MNNQINFTEINTRILMQGTLCCTQISHTFQSEVEYLFQLICGVEYGEYSMAFYSTNSFLIQTTTVYKHSLACLKSGLKLKLKTLSPPYSNSNSDTIYSYNPKPLLQLVTFCQLPLDFGCWKLAVANGDCETL